MSGPNTHGDASAYMREQADLIESLRNRGGRDLAARRGQQWAGKTGPTAFSRAYVNTWARGAQSATSSMDALADDEGILITRAGEYDIVATQRGNGTNGPSAFVNIAVNGDRDVLRQEEMGLWTFDHSAGDRSFSTARYLGFVDAESLITAGPSSTTGRDALTYSSTDYDGSILIRRVS